MRDKFNALRIRKKQLERYEKKILELEPEYVADVVKDYSKGGKHGIPLLISGYNYSEIDRLRHLYNAEIARLTREIAEVEEIIACEQDDLTQLILGLKYIDGYKLQEIADELDYSLETIKKRLSQFFKQFD